MKGRARITVPDDIVQLSGVKIEKPKSGAIAWGSMEVKELFELFQAFLHLPEGYVIIGVFFEMAFYQWEIIVESDAIPMPEPGVMIPVLYPMYQRTEDGKVSLIIDSLKLR
jgi:hypothetical protein